MNNALEYDPRYGIPTAEEQAKLQQEEHDARRVAEWEENKGQHQPVNSQPTADDESMYPF